MTKSNRILGYWIRLVDWLNSSLGPNARYKKLSPAVRRLIAADRAAMDHRLEGVLTAGALLLAGFLVILLWAEADRTVLVAWIAAYVAFIVVKLTFRYLRKRAALFRKTTREAERLKVFRMLLVFVHGAVWGGATVLFFGQASHSAQGNMLLALCVLNGAGVVLSTISVPLYLALLLPSMLPLQAMFLLHPSRGNGIFMLALPVILATFFALAKILHDVVSHFLELRYSNFEMMEEWRERIDRLEKSGEAKTRFLSVVSHDLRQPVHAIGLLADDLHDHVSDAPGRELLAGINSAIDSLRHSFESLLNLTKLEAAVIKPSIVSFSLQALFDRLDGEFSAVARERGVVLRFMPTRLATFTDPNMLHNIISNFVSNALYYCPKGRVTIGCRRRAGEIDILVFDTGPGIPPDRIDEIFEPFHRLMGGTQDDGGNIAHAGLGLAIAERTARALGHRIGVRSQPGKGSCFHVTVRLATAQVLHRKATPKAPEQIAADAADVLNGCTIAYLEDDPVVREQTVALFSRWGCVVRASSTVEDFLKENCSAATPPDLIVTDFRLSGNPDINGVTAIEQLNARLGRDIPAIVVSGDTTGHAASQAQRMGLKLIHKPAKPARLRTVLSELRRASVRGGARDLRRQP